MTHPLPTEPLRFPWHDWEIIQFQETGSTNEEAKAFGPWTAVTALRQTAGRGRHGRSWNSGEGGLWVSLVLPTPGEAARWKTLPLAIGLAVIRMLGGLDVQARMRWPNDIMVGDRKLAGLLLERHRPESVIAGIGINIQNAPGKMDPSLKDTAVRLADLSPSLPQQDELLCRLLTRVREVHRSMERQGLSTLLPELNRIWGPLPRPVVLHVQGQALTGRFTGVTQDGDLLLEQPGRPAAVYTASHVHLLRELP